MAEEWDYGNEWGASYDPWYPEYGTGGGYSGGDPSLGGWGYDPSTGQFSNTPMYEGGTPGGGGWSYDPSTGQFSQTPISGSEGGGSSWWQNALSTLGGLSGVLGPALQAGGALAGGAIGSNASSDAARLQANALNRGMDLQTAQWLQQQANQAPWLQAGQQALPQLAQLANQQPPGAFQGPPSISGQGYALPQIAPTWSPQAYKGPQYGPQGGLTNTKASGSGGYSTPGLTGGVNEQASTNFGDGMQTGGNMVQDASGNWVQSGAPQQSAFGPEGAAPAGGNWLTAAMLSQGGAPVPWAGDYRWTPGQGPSAANYRYTPGQTPDAAGFRWQPGQTPDAAQYQSGPPQLYQGAMPGTQVSTLTGQQVLDQDPGAAFRQSEARKALEGSAAAKGGLLSGSTLGALQRQSQDLASQEYGNAFNRMMQRDVEQYGRDWGQYQQNWNQGVQGTQLGLQTNAQNFGQAMSAAQLREQMAQQASQQGFGQQMSAAQLREQVNQVAAQQGWSQAQAEAAFREQMAQGASQQGFTQALAGQGQAWQQGLAGQQWEQQQRQAYDQSVYDRMMQQSQTQYGRDTAQNDVDYQRQLAAYNSQQQNQNTQWNRLAGLAGVGQTAANQLGETGYATQRNLSSLLAQLGQAQGLGAAGSGASWSQALGSGVNTLASVLSKLNA